ncbi:MAG: replicative DNA helicase [Firmicutes bacterium]|nr:replicative DNA helicase [Bacillota bacterium]
MAQNAQTATSRTLPNNLEAEQGVLSCVLIDNDTTISAFSKLTEHDFYSPGHKIIFAAMRTLFEKNSPVDFVTLVSHLDGTGQLEKVGGITYVGIVRDAVPGSANFRHYIEILRTNRVLRKLIGAGNTIIDHSFQTADAQTALQLAEKAVFDISKEDERKELTPLSGELPGVIEKLDSIQRDPASVRGLKTGFWALDNLTNGFQRADLVIIAARPSVGKTALSMNIVLNAALRYGAKCAIFSLEMSKQSLAMRALCSVAKVSHTRAMKGDMTVDEWKRVWAANKALAAANIYVDDNSVITPAEITRKCMRLKREQGLDLVMIDYLGLMAGTAGRRESRQVEVSDNSRMMKIMAKELDIPVLLLSQLNRGIEARKGADGKPMLSDLRESGAIEQDADIVMFIHKEKTEDNTPVDEAELIIAKHRNGPLGNIKVGWVGDYSSFTNLSREQAAQDALDARTPTPATPPPPTPEQPAPKKPKKKDEDAPKPITNNPDLLDVF